ncbi:MAG: hypothetical protein EOM69_07130, partial [Clostridia bacterium]|nr:hypothetical protein [Clostridia bacterium]
REPQVFLKELTSHLRALMTVKTVGEEAGELLEMTDEDVTRLSGQAQSAPEGKLLRMAELFMRAEGELRYASSPRVGLEVAALRACLPPTGESVAALMERVETLEKELSTLHAAIRSGTLAPAAAAKPAPKAAQEEAPAAKPAPKRAKPPKNEAEAWSRMLDQLKKTDPAMFGLLRNERFLGAKGNVYQLEIPIAKRASYDKLSEAKRKDRFSALLTEITGAPAVFEAVLAVDSAAQKRDAQTDKAQQQLIDAFGRDVVQVDEGNEEH